MSETAEQSSDSLAQFRTGVAEDLMSLAVLHSEELTGDVIGRLRESAFPDTLNLQMQGRDGVEALALLRDGIGDIPEPLDQAGLDILAAEYADIYLNHGFGVSPCESVWLDEDGLAMQEPMFQIRDFYKRHGLEVQNWRMRTDDHLVHQLQFISTLLESNAGMTDLDEVARFMDEHILRWVGQFGERIMQRASTRLYAGLARLTAVYLEELRDVLVELLNQSRPTEEEIEERMRPKNQGVSVAAPDPFVPGAGPTW